MNRGLGFMAAIMLLCLSLLSLAPALDVARTSAMNMGALWSPQKQTLAQATAENYRRKPLVSTWVSFPIDMWAQFSSDRYLYLLIRVAARLLGILAMSILLWQISKNFAYGVLFFVLCMCGLQNLSQSDPANAIIVSGHLALFCMASSLVLFVWYARSLAWVYLLASLVLYLLASFMFEGFLIFGLAFLVLGAAFWILRGKPWSFGFSRRVLRPLAFLAVILAIFVTVFFGISRSMEVNISSSDMISLDSNKAAKTYMQYTVSGLPFYHALSLPTEDEKRAQNFKLSFSDEGAMGMVRRLIGFFDDLRLEWVIKALMAIALVWILAPRVKVNIETTTISFLTACFFIFAPNLLLAFTSEHQTRFTINGFITSSATYFCQFGWLMLAAILVIELYRVFLFISNGFARAFLFIVAITIGLLSLSSDIWNTQAMVKDREISAKWNAVDKFIHSQRFTDIAKDALILSPTLFDRESYWERRLYDRFNEENYWTRYINSITGKEIKILEDPSKIEEHLYDDYKRQAYSLVYRQHAGGDNRFVIFSEIQEINNYNDFIQLYSSYGFLKHYSDHNPFYLSLRYKMDGEKKARLKIKNAVELHARDDYVFAKVVNKNPKELIEILCRDCLFDPGSVSISYYPGIEYSYEKKLVTKPHFAMGFYQKQSGKWQPFLDQKSRQSSWHWAAGNKPAKIRIFNGSGSPKLAKLSMRVYASALGKITVNHGEKELASHQFSGIKKAWTIENLQVLLDNGDNEISFQSSIPQIRDKKGRWISFCIEGFQHSYSNSDPVKLEELNM